MSIRIFVSYRRIDTRQVAGRLRDRLADAFGEENIFLDVDSIEFGADFRTEIRTTVAAVDAVVALIGPRFDVARLADENDFVRFELAEALAQGKLIVPVLVEDARMPAARDLPVELQDLSYRNAAPLRPDPDFRRDAARLIESLRRTLEPRAGAAASPPTEPVRRDHSPPLIEKAKRREGGDGQPPMASSALPPATLVPRLLPGKRRGSISSIAFSPDGGMLASGCGDKTVRLWDVGRGTEVRTWTGHDEAVGSVAFSPDGATVASAAGPTVRLWEAARGARIRSLHGRRWINSIAFSPDGATLATGSSEWIVRLLDVASGSELRTFRGHRNAVNSVAFSPSGAVLASGSTDGTVRLWDVATGAGTHTLTGHPKAVYAVAFSPDGARVVTGGNDPTVRLWDVATGTEIRNFVGDRYVVHSLAFSPDGALLAGGGNDSTVRLWDAAGTEMRTLAGHRNLIYSVAFAPQGRLLATAGGAPGGGDDDIRLWTLPR